VSPEGEDQLAPLMAAIVATLELMSAAIPGGWSRAEEGVFAAATGARAAMMNVVLGHAPAPPAALVGELLDAVAALGVPHSLQLRAAAAGELAAEAERRRMAFAAEVPLLALADAGRLEAALDRRGPGLVLRQIAPAEAPLHHRVGAAAFGEPTDIFARVTSPVVLEAPGMSCYVGELDGEPVATALSVLTPGHVAIFNVATLEGHRGRGYGAAITALAVRDGFARGARTAWLNSTPMGLGVYERLGFAVVDRWRTWITTA
jgi:ribosomal protein S18 acetylase RimI-like enzyme